MTDRNKSTIKDWLAAFFAVFLFSGIVACGGQAAAQSDFGVGGGALPDFTLGGFGASNPSAEPVVWNATYFADPSGEGVLEIEAELATHWHIYSTTQKKGGPVRTKFTVKPQSGEATDAVQIVGDFQPDVPPSKSVSSVYNGLTVEEHEDIVVWTAPIKVPFGFEQSITIAVDALVCDSSDGRCLPVREQLIVDYGGPVSAAQRKTTDSTVAAGAADKAAGSTTNAVAGSAAEVAIADADWFRDNEYVVRWHATVSPSQVAAGETATLTFTAKPDKGFHVYRFATDDAESSTNFVVTKKSGLKIGAPATSKAVISKSIVPSLPPVHYYAGQVSWSLPIQVPAGTAAGPQSIEGLIAYQACTDNSCHRPVALQFATQINVAETTGSDTTGDVTLTSAKSATALDAAAETKWVDKLSATESQPDKKASIAPLGSVSSGSGPTSGSGGNGGSGSGGNGGSTVASPQAATAFPIILGFAFLGGVILNVMPCVLPVVGLKIMGFVSQAGEDRRRVLILNLVYAAGILFVFALLAMLAVVFKFGWGQQFTYFPVKLGLTLGLFALALSYLGVWEIPAPGMASTKASQDLQSREGLTGAFSKGVFATVLATPCSGPMLGYILGLTLGLSSIQTIAIFMTVGLGMSLPYLLIGMQPKLIAWLPKPGNWMETFKEFMAFLFLGTVAFFFAQFQDYQKLPVFVSLIGVWFGCWIIGQVPGWSELPKRLAAWVTGVAAAALIGYASFVYLVPGPKVLAWEDYNEARLVQLQSEGKTVLLDFSAKWCTNCIYNYEFAINTEATRKLVDELDAVAMYADYTDFDESIQKKLEELQSRSIPLLAIYPGRSPDQPIILRDLLTQQNVLDALEQAGGSVDPTPDASSQVAELPAVSPAESSTSR
ncbi:Thiol:disulfide interchange protein DsbD precursor [Rubripirellula lacrimiformis]|uniref:Thiol:disulfide interchange protein DsbD n=1 Tax=Rubripirellula lacrimiformis TaxID=1930273 RepID=A0A517NAI1_9BACT|nr:thioredoxin family protein [Rubripirellula lacrimiformis]QDT04028.1 Thiol:disulfide interchange protein DsbD precursor [Rubripirellula lacrimiformis]